MNKREKQWIHLILISFVLAAVLTVMAIRTVQVTANEARIVLEEVREVRTVSSAEYEEEIRAKLNAYLTTGEDGALIAIDLLDMRIPPEYKETHLAFVIALQADDAEAIRALQSSISWLQ